jgi:LmbE family N-acetylglucosaminyl deacetylase
MIFHNETAEIFVPDGVSVEEAFARTTRMGIAAHQDDLEISCYHGIEACFGAKDEWFLGVIVTNGAGSPRAGRYESFSDAEMQAVRRIEQKKAAYIGEYSAVVLLDYPSSAVKDADNLNPVSDIKQLLTAAKPSVVYTHNLADKHDTHVAVALRAVQAMRELPENDRPSAVYGCESWRDLDWLPDNDKVVFDVSERENLAAALLGVFDSQICGGKRYDLAAMARRRANATFYESHSVDKSESVIYAMNLTQLINKPEITPEEYVGEFIKKLEQDVVERISKFSRKNT